jgi:hypothetical protein
MGIGRVTAELVDVLFLSFSVVDDKLALLNR